jgi:hypothetical protein
LPHAYEEVPDRLVHLRVDPQLVGSDVAQGGLAVATQVFHHAGVLLAQLRQLGASFPVFLSGGVRKVNVLAAFGKAFR